MDDILHVEIEDVKLNDRILELQDAFISTGQPGDCATVFEDESRLFLKQVIRLTPPKNKQQGENAVSKDLMKIFTPVDDGFLNTVGSQYGVSGIDAWLTTASVGDRMHIKWDRVDPTGAGMADFHHKNQNRRGRTRKIKVPKDSSDAWYAPYVISREDYQAYKEKIKARIGRKKAAWGAAFVGLGGKLQGWIGKHVQQSRSIFMHKKDPYNPSIVMGSYAPGVLFDERVVRSALRVRFAAVSKRLRLILSGYSKDVAQGIKISRKAKASPSSFQEAA